MKSCFKLPVILLSILSSLFFVSCETDIDVTSEWKDITIVYGLLSQNDSVHYFKINKAFLGDGNAIEYAKEPDSLYYYANIEVTLTEVNENGDVRVITFDTATVNRGEGIFPSRQLVYKSNFEMPADVTDDNSSNDKDYTYNLLIRNKITGKEVTSSTTLVKDFAFITPRPGQNGMDFIGENTQLIKWKSAKNARRYDVYIRFSFQEVTQSNDTTERYIDWVLSSVISNTLNGGEELQVVYAPLALYDISNSLIPYKDQSIEDNVKSRIVDKATYTIVASGDELNTYLDVNGPANGIIQDRPEYTNIENGLGLFSTRYTKKASLNVGDKTEEQFILRRPNLKFIDKLGN